MALMNRKEIEDDIKEHLKRPTLLNNVKLENPTIEELKPIILKENFSSGSIFLEFTSDSNRQYTVGVGHRPRATANQCKSMQGSIFLRKRIDKTPHSQEDYEDLKYVAETVAKKLGGKVYTHSSQPGMFTHDSVYNIQGYLSFHRIPTLLKIVDDVEKLRKDFRDIKITGVSFQNVSPEEIPERYFKVEETRVIKAIINEINGFIQLVGRIGLEEASDGASEYYPEAETPFPKWMRKIWEYPGTDEEVLVALREIREAYKQVMVKMGLLEPRARDTTQEIEVKRIFAFHWKKRKDLVECCKYYDEDYVFVDGPPIDIRACTYPEHCSKGFARCCAYCPEEEECDQKCPPLRKWLEMDSRDDLKNLAEACPHSEWDTADCDHPPDCTFLRCTLESKKPCCPEPGICCAQCNLISTCVLACPQFEGMVNA